MVFFSSLSLEGKKMKNKKPSTKQLITSLVGKVRVMCILWQLRKCRIGYFCAHWRNINLQNFFPLIISCILSIWYIKFIYNKLENKSLYMKLITFSEDPEDRFILTVFQQRLLVHRLLHRAQFLGWNHS